MLRPSAALHLYRDGAAGYDPEGMLSTAGAVASVLIGWLAGDLLRRRRVGDLVALSGVCFVLGVLWEAGLEVNKRLWTPSFVLVTAAISIGLIALAHVSVDRSRVASTFAFPLIALGRNALLVYVGQHVVGVWLTRAPHRLRRRVDVARRARRAAVDRTARGVVRVRTRDAPRLDGDRVRAARPALVRDAVNRRRWLVAFATALSLAAAACSGDDGGSAGSTAAVDSTRAVTTQATTTTASGPTTTVVLDEPDPSLATLPTDELPSGVAEDSPAAEVAVPSSVPSGSTSSIPVAPEFVHPATGGEPPTAVVPPVSPDLKIRYIVIPHPDDEFESWSMVANDTTHYIVFILLTRGEYSRYCDGSGISQLQAERSERLPQPQPFTGEGTAECAQQRVDAWASFLDGRGSVESAIGRPGFLGQFDLDLPEGTTVPSKIDTTGERVAATTYLLWVGDKSARFAFDFGDRDLSLNEVVLGVQAVRALQSRVLPISQEDDLVAGAYFNDSFDPSIRYQHPDHKVVQDAIKGLDFEMPGPQWGRTVPEDPDVAETLEIPPSLYCAVMCVNPEPIDPLENPFAFRVGTLQTSYGWLAPTYWVGAELPSGSIFSRVQSFWKRF